MLINLHYGVSVGAEKFDDAQRADGVQNVSFPKGKPVNPRTSHTKPISAIITSLMDTFERIRVATGRELELPSEYDLSRRQDRDRYHREKTGFHRERH